MERKNSMENVVNRSMVGAPTLGEKMTSAAQHSSDSPARNVVLFRETPGPVRFPTAVVAVPIKPTFGRTYRRRARLRRFVLLEVAVLLLLAISVTAGLSDRFADESLTAFFKTVTISLAVAAVVIPVAFYGRPKSDLRARRIRHH